MTSYFSFCFCADSSSDNLSKATATFNQAVKAASEKKFAEAETLFNKALEQYPDMPGAYVELGKLKAASNDYKKAVEYYYKAKETYTKIFADNHKIDAKAQAYNRDFASAGNDSRIAKSGSSTQAVISQSKNEQAEKRRNVVAEQKGIDIPAILFLYLGGALIKTGDLKNAEIELREGLKQDDKLAGLHFNLAFICLKEGRNEECIDLAKKAASLGLKIPEAFKKELEARGVKF